MTNPLTTKIWILPAMSVILSFIILIVAVDNNFFVSPTNTRNFQDSLVQNIHGLQQNIQELQQTQKSILLKEYSDFEPDLVYYLIPLKLENDSGGFQYDMMVTNIGKYDQNVTNTWWISRICDKNNNVIELPNNEKQDSGWIIKKGDDHTYFLQIDRKFSEVQNVKSFELGIFVQSHPWLSTGTVNEIDKTRKTFVQYDYDDKYKTWLPRFNNFILDCGVNIQSNYSSTLFTDKMGHFQVINN